MLVDEEKEGLMLNCRGEAFLALNQKEKVNQGFELRFLIIEVIL